MPWNCAEKLLPCYELRANRSPRPTFESRYNNRELARKLGHNLTPVRSALVFFAPEESFHTIRTAEDLSALLAKCGERALAIFEEKLDLSKRLGRSGRAQPSPEELNGP
jgi:hypothetical protein